MLTLSVLFLNASNFESTKKGTIQVDDLERHYQLHLPKNYDNKTDFSAFEPIPVMIINGTADKMVPWNGGTIGIKKNALRGGAVISTPETVNFWVKHNQCSATPAHEELPDNNPNDKVTVSRDTYHDNNNNEVILYTLKGGGHRWPGRPKSTGRNSKLRQFISGNTCMDINATKIIWEFFKKHKRK